MFFSNTYITNNGSPATIVILKVKLQPSTDVDVVMLCFVVGDRPLYSNLKVIAVPVLANLAYGSFKNTFIKKKILF